MFKRVYLSLRSNEKLDKVIYECVEWLPLIVGMAMAVCILCRL